MSSRIVRPLAAQPGHLRQLCAALRLGAPVAVPERVTGGFHHLMWHLQTDAGRFAVKQLGPDTDVLAAATVRHYNATEAIAEAFAQQGVVAVHALQQQSQYLQVIDGEGYLVYPWTDAAALDRKHLSAAHAVKVASLLAHMHRVDIRVTGLQEVPLASHAQDNILLLVDRAVAAHARGCGELERHLPDWLDIAARQPQARRALAQHRVISHGDMDQKNILWDAGGEPVLIDWESARPLNPTHDALVVALDWSGITSAFEQALFDRFIAAYRRAGGEIDEAVLPLAFDRILGNWLDWLMFNVGRSLEMHDREQRALGATQVDLALATLLRLQRFMPKLARSVRGQPATDCGGE
ncbi:MAG: aminoglycoside phosphotransferase family protein [Halioglobus sp.]|nr:aminoglycoside phosphotransferase family protein [Halioglobus sp.]